MIEAYLTDTVVWVKSTGTDPWGEPLPVEERTVRARVDWRTRLVRDAAGEQVVAAGTVRMKERPGHTDKLRIEGVDHAILQVVDRKAWTRSHYEVFIT